MASTADECITRPGSCRAAYELQPGRQGTPCDAGCGESAQIKLLEDFLGTTVFERDTRTLHVSEEGKAYVKVLSDTFERIDRATKQFLNSNRERPLHICCSMTFTLRWLVPRLPSFHAKHPTRGIRLTTSAVPFTPYAAGQDIDVFIGIGIGDWPPFRLPEAG